MERSKENQSNTRFAEDQNMAIQHFIGGKGGNLEEIALGKRPSKDQVHSSEE